jgi:alpha-tubulin suppressor-like RCC1 family protein
VPAGGTVTLSATVTGTPVPTLQWFRNGRPIAGATDANYAITNASAVTDAGWYQLKATNQYGTISSGAVFVIVSGPTQVVAWGDGSLGQQTVPAGLNDAVAISSAMNHALALTATGGVRAWGTYNSGGVAQVPAEMVSDVVGVAAGWNHGLALRADGSPLTWGTTAYGLASIPAAATGGVAVATGADHSLFLRADGTVVSWGANYHGQTTVPSGLADVIALAAGASHNLALKRDGTVVAWGRNDLGQCAVPSGLNGVVAIACGVHHSLALKSDGAIVAWGYNNSGQTTVPAGIVGALAVAAGGQYHSLAILGNRTVRAWGSDQKGQVSVPSQLSEVFAIAGGEQHSVALRSTAADTVPVISSQPAATVSAAVGQVVRLSVTASAGTAPVSYQWRKDGTAITGATDASFDLFVKADGAGSYTVELSNYLGNLTSSATAVSLRASPLVNLVQGGRFVVAGGANTTLEVDPALATNGASIQWKRNGLPVPGGTAASLAMTAAAPGKDAGWYQAVITSGGTSQSTRPLFVVVNVPSQIVAWGDGNLGQLSVPVGLNSAVAISAKWNNAVALTAAGEVKAWGTFSTQLPAEIPEGTASELVAVAAGASHGLALRANGTPVIWLSGPNWFGLTSPPSRAVGGVAVASGENHAVLLRSDGTVVAWGDNSMGQIAVPAGLSDVIAIAAGSAQTLALKADGTVVAWGRTDSVPTGLSGVVAVACGVYHNLALKTDGSVVSWGSQTTVPAEIAGARSVAAGGQFHNLALFADQTVRAWGGNQKGQATVPAGLGQVFAIAGGEFFSLALRETSGDTAPVISSQPVAAVTAAVGQVVRLSVTASAGTAPVSYQWKKNGTAIAGATGSTFDLVMRS